MKKKMTLSRDSYFFLLKSIHQEIKRHQLSIGCAPEWDCVFAVLEEWKIKGMQRIMVEKKEYKINVTPAVRSALRAVFGDIDSVGERLFSMVFQLTDG